MNSTGTSSSRAEGPRADGRAPDELRPISFERNFTTQTPGSVLVRFGQTAVLCTASVSERVPQWMKGQGTGWVSAEYAMLPGSSAERIRREVKRGRQQGRTLEIERLIGRSLRAVCDMKRLGEREVTVDCDVLEADGGTRTASICGGWVALHDALTSLVVEKKIRQHPLTDACAAISVGIVEGRALLDLPYVEDAAAEVDMNVAQTGSGRFIEVQGTAEGDPFTHDQLTELLALAEGGIAQIVKQQRAALGI